MKKVLKVTGIVILVIAALVFFVPRFIILGISAKYKSDIKTEAVSFSEYPAAFSEGGTVRADNGAAVILIPTGCEVKEMEKATAYRYENSDFAVIFAKPADFKGELISDDDRDSFLADWFGLMGRGLPDSGYATVKYAIELTPKDYSFWSLKKSVVYLITGILKSTMYHEKDGIYIYEKDNIRGVISTEKREGGNGGQYRIQCDFFRADDLNTINTVLISANSPEEAYPIISSFSFK